MGHQKSGWEELYAEFLRHMEDGERLVRNAELAANLREFPVDELAVRVMLCASIVNASVVAYHRAIKSYFIEEGNDE